MKLELDISDTVECYQDLVDRTDKEWLDEDLESVLEERIASLYASRDDVESQYNKTLD